jgi:hypothetical protein
MKTISIIGAALLFTACECKKQKPQTPPKYKQGDVVWLKPDSTRAVISHVWVSDLQYIVDYYDADHKAQDMVVPEFGIYSKVN